MPESYKELWSDDFLGAKRSIGDISADGVIESILQEEGPEQARKVFDILIRNIEMPLDQLPPQVSSFVETTATLPDWTDFNQIALSQAYFQDHGPKFLPILYFKSLPTLYSFVKGSQVLVKTGRLAHKADGHKQFARRIAETGQFLINVMAPKGFENSKPAIAYTQKVRLIHAAIRKFVQRKDWDVESLGIPINQEDLAGTLMTFSISILEGMEQFGLQTPDDVQEAYLHHWKVVGHILGINADLLPDNIEQGQYLLSKIIERNSGASEAGVVLTKALISFAEEVIPSEHLDNAGPILIRFLVGDQLANHVGVTSNYGCLGFVIPKFISSLFRVVERLEDRSEPIQILFEKLSMSVSRKMVSFFNEYKGQKFEIPKELQESWKL